VTALESQIERKCVESSERHGCLLIKIEKRLGWPDRVLLAPNGKMVWVEFKRVGEDPRKIQTHIHQMLRGMNFEVRVVDSHLQFLAILQLLLGSPPLSGSPLTTKSEGSDGLVCASDPRCFYPQDSAKPPSV
jgi:hypothetical protein